MARSRLGFCLATLLLVGVSGAASAHTITTSQWDVQQHRMVTVKHWTLFAPHPRQAHASHHWFHRLFHALHHSKPEKNFSLPPQKD